MAGWLNGTFKEEALPFPNLVGPVIVWFDYDGDGWIDLFLAGSEPIEGKENMVKDVTARLYKNQQGHLEPTKITFDVPESITSAHVIDFNQDSQPDLFLGLRTGSNAHPSVNRIFLNRTDNFEEVEFPLAAIDKLEGLSRANVANADFDGDGLSDILVSGCWNSRIGPKTYIVIAYKKLFHESQGKYYLRYHRKLMDEIPNILGKVIIEDLDGDEDKDIFVSGFGTDLKQKIMCFENKEGTFRPVTNGPWSQHREQPLGRSYGGYSSSVIPIDVNHDGLLDFICFPSATRTEGKGIILLLNVSGRAKTNGGTSANDGDSQEHQRE